MLTAETPWARIYSAGPEEFLPPHLIAAKSVSLDVFKIGQPQGPARS
jgi:hypothetical protein